MKFHSFFKTLKMFNLLNVGIKSNGKKSAIE